MGAHIALSECQKLKGFTPEVASTKCNAGMAPRPRNTRAMATVVCRRQAADRVPGCCRGPIDCGGRVQLIWRDGQHCALPNRKADSASVDRPCRHSPAVAMLQRCGGAMDARHSSSNKKNLCCKDVKLPSHTAVAAAQLAFMASHLRTQQACCHQPPTGRHFASY